MTERRKLTSAQAAELAGVKTWSAYTARGACPADGRAEPYDLPWWWSTTVEAWISERDKRIAARTNREDAT